MVTKIVTASSLVSNLPHNILPFIDCYLSHWHWLQVWFCWSVGILTWLCQTSFFVCVNFTGIVKKKNIDVTLQKFTFFANTFFVRVVSSVCLLFFKKTWIGGCVGWLFETLLRFILTDIGRRHFLCVLWKEQLFVLHFSTTVTYVTQSHLVAAFLYISCVLHHSDIWNICSGLWGTLTNGS